MILSKKKTVIEKLKIQLKNIYFVNIGIILCELGPTTNECECQTVECLLSLLLTEVVGSIPTEVKRFLFTSCGSLIPFTRANAQWVIHGFN